MRTEQMSRGWRAAASLAGLLLVAAACTSTETGQAGGSPSISAATQTSPSSSPSTSPGGTGEPTPSSTPTSPATGAGLAITGLPFHNGEVGIGYLAVTLTASGGTAPYQWSDTGGTFPPGLHLSTDGVVTGTTTTAGHFSFTVQVADGAGASASSPSGLGVFAAMAVTQPCASQCAVEEGCTVCGVFGTVSGGLAPYHYSVSSDNRPSGMGLSGLTLTGAFPPPGPLGSYNMTVQVSDVFGAQQSVNATWYVFPHITLGASQITCGNSANSCVFQIPYSGGTPGGGPVVTILSITGFGGKGSATVSFPKDGCGFRGSNITTSPPPGALITAGGGLLTISMGPPNNQSWCGYSGRITLVLTDQSLCGPGNCHTNTLAIDISL